MYHANLTKFSIYLLDKFPRRERPKSRIKSRKQNTPKRTRNGNKSANPVYGNKRAEKTRKKLIKIRET